MAEKILEYSTRAGTKRSSCYLASIDSLDQLVWKDGQIHMQGVGPQGGVTPKTETPSSCHGYSATRNPSHVHKAVSIDEDASCIAENARLNAIQTPTTNNNSLRQEYLGKVNFSPSPFHRTTLLPTHNSTVVAAQVKASNPDHHHSVVIDDSSQRSISHGLKGPLKPVPFVPRNLQLEVAPDDEHSEIVGGHNSAASALRIHGSHSQCHNHQASKSAGLKANNGKACNVNNCYEEEEEDDASLTESSSVCSLGASNYNTSLSTRKKHDDYSTYSLSDNEEEPEDLVKDKLAREGSTGVKRRRNVEIHRLSERKRRDKINKKMRILKDLIPNCNKMDKASMLDDAIVYLKTLKFQLQIMSMGLCMPLMMLPHFPHQLMGAGIMGFRPGTGMIPCSLPQFPIAPMPAGFPKKVPTIPIPHAPNSIPMVGNPSIQPPLLPTSTASRMAENQASAQLTIPKSPQSPRTHILMDRPNEYATKQALNISISEQAKKFPNIEFGGSDCLDNIGAWTCRYDSN